MLTVRSTINIASQTVPPIIPVVQGDTGRAILFTLADFTIPAGASATYYVQKPSGEAVYNNATIDGNTVLVELTAQSIIEKGDNYGQVRIAVGEDVVTSFDFILLVKEFRGIDAVQSLTEMNIFDKAVEQAAEEIDEVKTGALDDIGDAKDAALEEINQSTGNFADAFSASTAYAAGDYVIHSGQLYRFTANHAAGAWTGSDAEAITVGEELTDLKADTSTLKEDLDVLKVTSVNVLDLTALSDGWIKSNGTIDTTDTTCSVTPYLEVNGTSITHSAFIESAYETQTKYIRQIAFYDSSKTFISRDSSNAVTYAVPDNAAYAIVNLSKSYIYTYSMLSWTSTKLDKWYPYMNKQSGFYSPIYGKSVLCVGDSICKGDNWSSTSVIYPNSNTGWAKIMHDSYNCQVYGFGISGATIRKITDNTNSVYEQFASFVYYATSHTYTPDYILLEGGINDATRYYNGTDTDSDFGALVDGYGQSNDYTTTIGALERMFYTAKVTFPTSKIIYILPHHCSGSGFQTALLKYINGIKTVCDKWSVPYIDLYTKGHLNGCITALRADYFDEYGVHPNEEGYNLMTTDIIVGMGTV